MSHSKDILPENEEGLLHGYCEVCYDDGQLKWKGVCVHVYWFGYQEYYNRDGSVDENGTGYWMSGNKVSADNEIGYCLIWNREEL